MEDYEPMAEESDEVTDMAAMPRPVFGECDYYRGVEGEHQQWISPLTPIRGRDPLQRPELSHNLNYVERRSGEFASVTGPASMESQTRHFQAPDAAGSQMDSAFRTWGGQDEMYQVRDDAAMEALGGSDIASRHDNISYMNRTPPIFAQDQASLHTNENYMHREPPIFSQESRKVRGTPNAQGKYT